MNWNSEKKCVFVCIHVCVYPPSPQTVASSCSCLVRGCSSTIWDPQCHWPLGWSDPGPGRAHWTCWTERPSVIITTHLHHQGIISWICSPPQLYRALTSLFSSSVLFHYFHVKVFRHIRRLFSQRKLKTKKTLYTYQQQTLLKRARYLPLELVETKSRAQRE